MDIQFGDKQFTFEGDRDVESHIRLTLKRITRSVVKAVAPVGLFLYGSYGRGEGTAYLENGNFASPSDFEIGCISRNWLIRRRLHRKKKQLERELRCDITVSFFFPHRIKLGKIGNFSLRYPQKPTIESYEITNSIFPLYGKTICSSEAYSDPKDIPLWEGIRLLFNRMAEFLISIASGDQRNQQKAFSKLGIACGDSLLLTVKKYHYLYFQRLESIRGLRKVFLSWDMGLRSEDIELLEQAYEWKLRPLARPGLHGSTELRRLAIIVDRIFRHLIHSDMSITFESYKDLACEYAKSFKLRREYYRGFSGNAMAQNSILLAQRKISIRTYVKHMGCPVSIVHQFCSQVPGLFFKYAELAFENKPFVMPMEDARLLNAYSRIMG